MDIHEEVFARRECSLGLRGSGSGYTSDREFAPNAADHSGRGGNVGLVFIDNGGRKPSTVPQIVIFWICDAIDLDSWCKT